MGSWGYGSFDNDPSLDWADYICDHSGFDGVIAALNEATDLGIEYLEVDESCAAIAAAEVVAALKGSPGQDLPEELAEWVRAQQIVVDTALIELSIKAIERVKRDSESQDLWEEVHKLEEWHKVVSELETRLRQ